MIDFYYWTTPNGHKITIFLEEASLPYSIKPINIGAGQQFTPEFLALSPNNRIPAIVDRGPSDGGAPVNIFESGAILQYLAEKTGQFLPKDLRGRTETMQWLFWQMGGLGPMLGQNHHFSGYAPPLNATLRRLSGFTACSTSVLLIVSLSPARIRLPIWPLIRGSCHTKDRGKT
jgi:GST-like protein